MPERTCMACGGRGKIREGEKRGLNLSLPEEQIELLVVTAERRKRPASHLAQEALERYLKGRRRRKTPEGVEEVWADFRDAEQWHYGEKLAPKRRLSARLRKLIAQAIVETDLETVKLAQRGLFRSPWHLDKGQLSPDNALEPKNLERLAGYERAARQRAKSASSGAKTSPVDRIRSLALEVVGKLEEHGLVPAQGLRLSVEAAESTQELNELMRRACRAGGYQGPDWLEWEPAEPGPRKVPLEPQVSYEEFKRGGAG